MDNTLHYIDQVLQPTGVVDTRIWARASWSLRAPLSGQVRVATESPKLDTSALRLTTVQVWHELSCFYDIVSRGLYWDGCVAFSIVVWIFEAIIRRIVHECKRFDLQLKSDTAE